MPSAWPAQAPVKESVPLSSTELEREEHGQDEVLPLPGSLGRTIRLWGPSHPPGKELLAAGIHGIAGRAEVGSAEEGHAVTHLRWHMKEA